MGQDTVVCQLLSMSLTRAMTFLGKYTELPLKTMATHYTSDGGGTGSRISEDNLNVWVG